MQYRIREQKELKPSGVEWLGDIPNSWDLKRLKYISQILSSNVDKKSYENEIEVLLCNYVDVYKNEFITNKINFMKATANQSEIKKFSLQEGDIQITKDSESPDDIAIPAYVNEKLENILCGYHLSILRNNKDEIYSKYLFRFFELVGVRNYFETMAKGVTRYGLSIDSFRHIFVPSFDVDEQQKIANFLDEKSKTFDYAISKKEELITKLQDAKQSLISEVVTGKLKVIQKENKLQTIKRKKEELINSNVDWLGDIPKDWQVKKTKYLFEIRKRISGTLGYDILSITQKGIKIKDITTGGGQLSMDYSKYQIVNVGDFAMNHMDLLTGFVDIAKTQGVTSPDYRVFTLIDKNSDSNYYLYLYQMGYRNQIFFAFGQGSSQLGRWRLPTEEFKKFYFPNPSKDEQKLISKYLDSKLIHFDNTIEKTKQSIIKLKLAKESLISEAVTGKIEIL
jgi:type I restriction enzyme S subunit